MAFNYTVVNKKISVIMYRNLHFNRIKNAWMYKDELIFLENKAAEMVLPSIEGQANPPPKPLQVREYRDGAAIYRGAGQPSTQTTAGERVQGWCCHL